MAFLNFMSAYAIFMAPMAGTLTADYWLIKSRKHDVPALYDPHGIYRFGWGGNWRALAMTLLVICPLLPGLGWKVTPQNVQISVGLQHLFDFNWLYGFLLSIVLYYIYIPLTSSGHISLPYPDLEGSTWLSVCNRWHNSRHREQK